jgi:hypothetical protein
MKSTMSIIRLGVMAIAIIVAISFVKRHGRPRQERPASPIEEWSELDLILPRAMRGEHDPLAGSGGQPVGAAGSAAVRRGPGFAEMAPFVVEAEETELEIAPIPLEMALTLPPGSTEINAPELVPPAPVVRD